MTTEGERLASLEAYQEEAARARSVIFDKLESQDADLAAIRNDVHAIKLTLSGYKGFFAGASFAIAALGGLIGALLTALWTRLTG